MSKCRQYENHYSVIVNFIDESVFLSNSSGINRAIVSFERFNLSRTCTRMLSDFV